MFRPQARERVQRNPDLRHSPASRVPPKTGTRAQVRPAHSPPRVFFPKTQPLRSTRPTRPPAPRPNPRLPHELVKLVIEQLRDHKSALARCSLVSRAWAKSAAPHFFGCIRWPRCHHYWSDGSAPQAACRCHDADLDSLHLVLGGSQRICEAVVDLRVSFQREGVEDGRRVVAAARFFVDKLFAVLDALPKLRRLELSAFLDTLTWAAGVDLTQRPGRTLDVLVLRRCVVDAKRAAQLVAYFTRIGELTLVQPRAGGALWTAPADPHKARSKTTVGSLQILDCPAPVTRTCLRTLQPVVPAAALHSLALGQLASAGDTAAAAALARCAPLLQSLRLGLVFWLPSFADAFGGAPPRERLRAAPESDWPSVVRVLDELGPDTHEVLRTVRLDVAFRARQGPDAAALADLAMQRLWALDWSVLEDAVGSLASLERLQLCFSFDAAVDVAQWRAEVIGMLQRQLSARTWGIVEVTTTLMLEE